MALGERDCSLQRRNQKVVEEAPAPNLPASVRADLIAAAVRLGEAANYVGRHGRVLYDADREQFFFLEMNTRLQVEHGVTEEVMGIDLVEWMIRGAAGDFAMLDAPAPQPQGAIQVRLYAEDPAVDYRPTSGTLTAVSFPDDIRAETWCMAGTTVSAWYDPMLAKLIVHAPTRAEAVTAMQQALDASRVDGIETNLRWLRDVVRAAPFVAGEVSTRLLDGLNFGPRGIRVISGGTATTVQDWPGRQGLWAIGVPPSGPMDDQSFRLGNRLLGNPEGTAGLEMTITGPILLFNAPARICLMGADFKARLDGVPVERGVAIDIAAGQTLAFGRVTGGGLRGYILIAGWTCRPISAAAARSSWASSAAMPRAGCWRAIRCIRRARPRAMPFLPRRCPIWRRNGRCACSMARTARRTSSPTRTSTPSWRRNGRSTTTATAPACGWSAPSRNGRAPTGARRAAPVEHPRQSLCHRRGGFHRRHADHPRA
jgi:urea carboxylase